jgi:hypothetical protein
VQFDKFVGAVPRDGPQNGMTLGGMTLGGMAQSGMAQSGMAQSGMALGPYPKH